jgi:hypothetical protein
MKIQSSQLDIREESTILTATSVYESSGERNNISMEIGLFSDPDLWRRPRCSGRHNKVLADLNIPIVGHTG